MRDMGKLVFLAFLVLMFSLAHAQEAYIQDSTGTATNLFFTGDSTDPKTWYQDAIDGNPDVGIKVCGLGGPKYVGATYAINVGGTWQSVLVSYKSSTEALAYTDQNLGGDCYFTSPGYLTISPSHLSTPSPDVYYASFPGLIRVTYSDVSNPGSLSNFIKTNQKLLGDYSVSRSFDQITKKVNIQTPQILFQSQAGSFYKQADDSVYGINTDRRMVIGLCDDIYGDSCYDGTILSSPSFPLNLDAGTPIVDDQHKYDRYVVINGIGKHICIGANLKVTLDSIQPNPVYYSQILNITFTITNYRDSPTEDKGGNVDVTTPFKVRVRIYPVTNSSNVVFDNTYQINQVLTPGSSLKVTVQWNATAHSGDYQARIDIDSNGNIVECNEGDNMALGVFTLKPIILPEIYINDIKTTTFPAPGVPYNVTMHIKNSDGENVSNATVILTEINGLSPFSPLQIWNSTVNSSGGVEKTGTKIYNEVRFKTDYWGNVELALIPTGNPLYGPSYSYLGAKDVLGNYTIHLTGYSFDGEPFVFVRRGVKYDYMELAVNNYYTYDQETDITPPNRPNFVDLAMNLLYTIFSKFWKAVT